MDVNLEVHLKKNTLAEIYFLIQKFLSVGPLQESYKVFIQELDYHKILPKRLDWTGNEHERSLTDWERLYPHVGPDYLAQICNRIGPLLDKLYPPSVRGVGSLLGAGQQSLLRNEESKYIKNNSLRYYAARRNGRPLSISFSPRIYNISSVIVSRQLSGPVARSHGISPLRYSQLQLQRKTLGHLSAVYCLLFDRHGKYILTGADDLLIKLWSSISGRLLATFRGASAEITDIAINLENTLLAAGSIDRILRVWDLQTGAPVATLTGHTGMITSVNFCPSSRWDIRYVITTSTDGSVSFWTYSHSSDGKANFVSKPIQYQEKIRPGQAQMICSSFSPGGTFLATGSADHHVRVYFMKGDEGPQRILESEAHTDRVDSIQWAHQGLRFISGSKDGTTLIWHFESQQWRHKQLNMSAKLPNAPEETEDPKKLKVTMVSWDNSDTWVVTAVSDHRLKVWRAATGELERVLKGHVDEIYVLESHPLDPHVILSAGHDGQLFIWDILRGQSVTQFMNNIEGQGYGAIFDAKWSPDGTMIAATDSHGHILTFGFGSGHSQLKQLPLEMFFHTDYRPLIRDCNNIVLDEQTQVPPHLMPPPFLVDVDGNPYPPMLQRLVPGREHCQAEQLIPNIVVGVEGTQEVIEGLPDEQPHSNIDRMIAALAQRQFGQEEENENGSADNSLNNSRNARRSTVRRVGEGGIRQSTGNWQRDNNIKWNKNVLVQPLKSCMLESAKDEVDLVGTYEFAKYRREMRRRPVMINTAAITAPNNTTKGKRHKNKSGYRTRSAMTNGAELDPEEEEASNTPSNSEDSAAHEDDEADELTSDSSSDSSESSGYSDWVADHGENLEPPKRSKRRQISRSVSSAPTNEKDSKKATTSKNVNEVSTTPPEVPEIYRPLEWLTETMPRKAPYFPQMGDEVVYFRQGHQLYVDAVRTKSVYEVNPKDLPWTKFDLKDHEFVKVVGIKYEIRPPRLGCLKLALLDQDNRLTGNVFTIKYHDMADVLDFFVLRQVYDSAIARNWNVGDKFRCIIDDGWWMGEIMSKSPTSNDFPDSKFMCYEVRWDNGEFERMSPWDLEPIREDRLPENVGEAVPVLPEEIHAILYQPQVEEWPRGDRVAACRKIIVGLDKLMALAIAEHFLAPVDLSHYPTYAYIVEYPIDLSTIKARFENHFYRRITSAQFDVRYLATNAEKYNEPHSDIVKHARIITDLCLRIIKGCSEEFDVVAIYHQLMDTYQSSESEVEVDITQPGPSSGRTLRSLTTRSLRCPDDWKHEARALLDGLWQCEDSAPFRTPVDHLKHPDYYQVIDTPMDLGTVKEDLLGGNYENPHDFCKDMRLIFQNSKNYNTNKRSRIYAMTIRLSAMFEEHVSRIIYNWKTAKRRELNAKKKRVRLRNHARASIENDSVSSSDTSKKATKPPNRRNALNGQVHNGNTLPLKRSKARRSSTSMSESEISSSSSSSDHSSESTTLADLARTVNNGKQTRNPAPKRAQRLSSDCSDSEDDNLPLSSHVNHLNKSKSDNTTASRNNRRRRISSDSDNRRTCLRKRQNKKPRYNEDSDSDDDFSVSRTDYSDDSDRRIVTVSSRGRVRKLTPRARALFK